MRARFKKWNFYSDRVEVCIEGFQIGKLLDAAAKNGILLRSVRVYAETEAQAEIAACDLKRLQKLAGARYRVKPKARRGAVYQTRAFLRRPVLAIGVLLAAAIVVGESFFVAAVEIDDCDVVFRVVEGRFDLCGALEGDLPLGRISAGQEGYLQTCHFRGCICLCI